MKRKPYSNAMHIPALFAFMVIEAEFFGGQSRCYITRMAATTLLRSQTNLGAQCRRLRSKLGAPKAVTAMARRLVNRC